MTIYLVDKSAWEWARRDISAGAQLRDLIDNGHVLAGSHITAMELAYSARNAKDHARVLSRQRGAHWLPVNEAVMDRALEIIAMLAIRGQHRTPIPDVIIAATAEVHGATVLHVDSDFDLIAAVTGQPTLRLPTAP